MCSSARSPDPRHVAAAMFTPASVIAAATSASAPGVFSMSITRSKAIDRELSQTEPAVATVPGYGFSLTDFVADTSPILTTMLTFVLPAFLSFLSFFLESLSLRVT